MCSTTRRVTPSSRTRRIDRHRVGGLGRGQAGHELVEQEEVGAGGERPGQLEAPPLEQAQARRRARAPWPRDPTRARKRVGRVRSASRAVGAPAAVQEPHEDVVDRRRGRETAARAGRSARPRARTAGAAAAG